MADNWQISSHSTLLMRLSVIVPTLNEERVIGLTLDAIRRGAPTAEIIVADGASTDRTVEIARLRGAQTLIAPRGRALQMNAGAAAAHGEALVFVHADTRVPVSFAADIASALVAPEIVGGRFDIELDESSFASCVLGKLISFRSRMMRSATGDQAIFVRRHVFMAMDGFTEIDVCEDVDFARRLKRRGPVACLRSRVVTSARRWRQHGMLRTVLKMWLIKSLFLAGVSSAKLRRYYADVR
jgi:rSAM/selenodomain-associated transferase 2